MVKKKDAFVKPHLTPADLDGKSVNITIKDVKQVSVYDYKQKAKVLKWAMFFPTTRKFMILNETNWDLLTEIFGSDDSEDWLGHKVIIRVEEIFVGGDPVDALRFTDSPEPSTVDQAPLDHPELEEELQESDEAPKESDEDKMARLKEEATQKNLADKSRAEKPW